MINCPKCGSEIPKIANFCPYCMTKFGENNGKSAPIEEKNSKKYIFIIGGIVVALIVILLLVGVVLKYFDTKSGDKNDDKIPNEANAETTESIESTTEHPASPNYMGMQSVYYDENNSRHRLLWGFMYEEGGELVRYDADIIISITNESGEEVYNNTISVGEENYTIWTNNTLDDGKLLGCIYINDEDIKKSANDEGTLAMAVKFEDGTGFDWYEMNIYNLPVVDFSLSTPSLPYTVENWDFDGNLESVIEILEITPSYSYDSLWLQVQVKMTYSIKGDDSNNYPYIRYKIKDSDGMIVSSNDQIIGPLMVGDTVVEEFHCRGDLVLGEDYTIELMDVK